MLKNYIGIVLFASLALLAQTGCQPPDDSGGGSVPQKQRDPEKRPHVEPEKPKKTPEEEACEARGYTWRAFEEVSTPGSAEFEKKVSDFAFREYGAQEGEFWKLSEHWTGCDNYVIIPLGPYTSFDIKNAKTLKGLITNSDPNVYYIFSGNYPSEDKKFKGLKKISDMFNASLSELESNNEITSEQKADWEGRILFADTSPKEMEGSIGKFFKKLSQAEKPAIYSISSVAITREQKFVNGGVLSKMIGFGQFESDINDIGYSTKYYNYLFDLQNRLEVESKLPNVKEIKLIDDTKKQGGEGPPLDANNIGNNNIYKAEFPSKEEMKDYDSLEFIIQSNCGDFWKDCFAFLANGQLRGTDYEAIVSYCSDENCTKGGPNFIRWITSYPRPGIQKWVVDGTPFLPLFKEGGDQYMKFTFLWYVNVGHYVVTARLKKSAKTDVLKPFETVKLFSGGDFDGNYKTKHPDVTFKPPVGTKKVELIARISGHGGAPDTNCAEWCDHSHKFVINNGQVNKKEVVVDFGTPELITVKAGANVNGCADLVSLGVVPNQGGNWAPGREGWCPGWPLPLHKYDITDSVDINKDNTISYDAFYNKTMTPPGQGAFIHADILVVYSK